LIILPFSSDICAGSKDLDSQKLSAKLMLATTTAILVPNITAVLYSDFIKHHPSSSNSLSNGKLAIYDNLFVNTKTPSVMMRAPIINE